ncbi:flavin reductase family protein [Halorientalis sp.]|uniref:flavin reductase family protein n=1 Tax=Halorientalis sp. TaxID=1931229 RepID=UPI002631982D|nr:flavin reductase family protein [Halorientalis sp.]
MQIDPETHDRSLYRTMTGAVVPRPIGWISTTGEDGVDNLAPYSYFNVVSADPPVVMFSPADKSPDELKDSARNVVDTGEFVHNVVTRPLAESMSETSAMLPPDESEFDHTGLERAASEKVDPPRVAAADVAFECELYDVVDVGVGTMILGEIVLVHVDDNVTTDGKVDVKKVDAVGRLAGNYYASTDDRFRIERPD